MNKETINQNDGKLLEFSRQLLDNSLDELDDAVLSRLRHSRQQAIKAAAQTGGQTGKRPFAFPAWLAPVSTGTTFASIAITGFLFWTQPVLLPNQNEHMMEDINLLSASDDLELYQDLEFYLWLDDETAS